MALYIPHSIIHLARLLYVRPETFGPYYVHKVLDVSTVTGRSHGVQPNQDRGDFRVGRKTTLYQHSTEFRELNVLLTRSEAPNDNLSQIQSLCCSYKITESQYIRNLYFQRGENMCVWSAPTAASRHVRSGCDWGHKFCLNWTDLTERGGAAFTLTIYVRQSETEGMAWVNACRDLLCGS